MPSLPNILFISAEIRLAGISFQLGIARDASGRGYVTGGFGGPYGIIDAGPVEGSATAMIAAAIVAVVGAKATINVGGAWQPIEDFVDMGKPSVTATLHYNVGFQGAIDGNSFAFTFGPGFASGYSVSTQGGEPIKYIPTFGDIAYVTLYTLLQAGGLSNDTIHQALGIPKCFVAGTKISMADGSLKNIEDIAINDVVMSFDPHSENNNSIMVPNRVVQTFRNHTKVVVDVCGIRCTPGHVFLTTNIEGGSGYRFCTITQILKEDGVIVRMDGTVVRARTGNSTDSAYDSSIQVKYYKPNDDRTYIATVRLGIPVSLKRRDSITSEFKQITQPLLEWLTQYGVQFDFEQSRLVCDGRAFSMIDWPSESTPVDNIHAHNWIVSVGDNKHFVPDWVTRMSDADDKNHLSARH